MEAVRKAKIRVLERGLGIDARVDITSMDYEDLALIPEYVDVTLLTNDLKSNIETYPGLNGLNYRRNVVVIEASIVTLKSRDGQVYELPDTYKYYKPVGLTRDDYISDANVDRVDAVQNFPKLQRNNIDVYINLEGLFKVKAPYTLPDKVIWQSQKPKEG
ncbi:hypothetical protein SPFM15_00076 [Salmonella phage SPFM15]|nr:hypothetical protein SPFM5_00071 [Salmonella phage SPFM5]VFR13700.1 hypothetical protein SPFM15_00076 [Salmonella phage SPFM15]